MLEYEIIEDYFHLNSCGITDTDSSKLLKTPRCQLHKLKKMGTADLELAIISG